MTKILLVEDNEMNRDMLTRRLTRLGYAVVCATDGREGISVARTEQADIILMDLSLPIMDGWEALQMLKSDPSTKHIPVIALTAHALVSDRNHALSAGFDDYESKPVEFPRLVEKISSLLSLEARNE